MPNISLILKGFNHIQRVILLLLFREVMILFKKKYFHKLITFYLNQNVKVKLY